MPVNSGWANNCGIELFTIGWVQCPSGAAVGGGQGRTRRRQPRDEILRRDHRALAIREDEEFIAVIQAYFSRHKH